MRDVLPKHSLDRGILIVVGLLVSFSIVVLNSIAPFLFPNYYVYIVVGFVLFFFFSKIEFEVLTYFSKHFYIFSLAFLVLPLVVGQVTRGAVRWVNVGALTVQPAEIVRPFLFVYFSALFSAADFRFKSIILYAIAAAIPLFLIVVQPSLGVSVVTGFGILGILVASGFNKKVAAGALMLVIVALPLLWNLLAPYQKDRVATFLSPDRDPYGSGYNSIQSTISVGSGKITGRGLGEGVQTQLAFLPERHTDFIFASVAEEMGFLGASILIALLGLLLYRITVAVANSSSAAARAFSTGIFISMFMQLVIHIGMNMGLFPITGLPLPLFSAGGSSFIATMASLGMVSAARKIG